MNYSFDGNFNIQSIIYVIGAILLLVALLYIGYKLNNIFSRSLKLNKRFNKNKFYSLADEAKLSPEEQELLLSSQKSKNNRLLNIFDNLSATDSLLRHLYSISFDKSEDRNLEDDLNTTRMRIFDILRKLEIYHENPKVINSTRGFSIGIKIFISIKERLIPIIIVAIKPSGFTTSIPAISDGRLIKLPINLPVRLIYSIDGLKHTFIYQSKIKGYARDGQKRLHMHLSHGHIIEEQHSKRKDHRKEIDIPCSLVEVKWEQGNYKTISETIFDGLIHEVSISGCSFIIKGDVNPNNFFLLAYNNIFDNERIRVVCKVIRHSKLSENDATGVFMVHAQFIKLPPRDYAIIAAYIYDYEREQQRYKYPKAKNKVLDGELIAKLDDRIEKEGEKSKYNNKTDNSSSEKQKAGTRETKDSIGVAGI